MDFACKQIDVEQVLKCALGISKAGCAVLHCLANKKNWATSEQLAQELDYDLATIQRNLKHLHERGILQRIQQNKELGGYEYTYSIVAQKEFLRVLEQTLHAWMQEAKKELEHWTIQTIKE